MPKTPYLREKDEEVYNSLTHTFALGLMLAGTIAMWVRLGDSTWQHAIGVLSYGISMCAVFLSSAVYHMISEPVAKRRWRQIDHQTIYIAIAGGYTGFFMLGLEAFWAYALTTLVWASCIGGMYYKWNNLGKNEWLSLAMYLVLGWVGAIVFIVADTKPINDSQLQVLFGGALYSAGTYFYYYDYRKYNHTIWHILVIVAAAVHYHALWVHFIP